MAEETKERKSHKVVHTQVKKGDLMAFTYWGRIKSIQAGGTSVDVEGLDDQKQFAVHGAELICNSFSADQFHEEEKVTKTRAAELLTTSHNRPLTVKFTKQGGEERVLRGRLLSAEPLLGRSYVEDLDINGPSEKRIRLVDHREIHFIIVDGVKYTVGK